jgi:ABC-type transporter Mla MlaB component
MRWLNSFKRKTNNAVKVEGALTLATIAQRYEALSLEASQLTAPKTIDVSALSDFDSAGFACLTSLKRQYGATIVGASDRLRALASTYGATTLLS